MARPAPRPAIRHLLLLLLLLSVALSSNGFAEVTEPLDLNPQLQLPTGAVITGDIDFSADGRYAAFRSDEGLIPGVPKGVSHIYRRDRWTGQTEAITKSFAGDSGVSVTISDDGEHVVFFNPIYAPTARVYVGGVGSSAPVEVSVSSAGTSANDGAWDPDMSADGRFVVFLSAATNLVPGDTNSLRDVFLHDRDLDADGVFDEAGAICTVRVTVGPGGVEADATSFHPGISDDGRYVSFVSFATNLTAAVDDPTQSDVFLYDRLSGVVEKVSVSTGGVDANKGCENPTMSADGRYVAFESDATNLVPNDLNGVQDIFIRDRQLGTTWRLVHAHGPEFAKESLLPILSPDGRYLAFSSETKFVFPDPAQSIRAWLVDRDSDGDGVYDEPFSYTVERIGESSAGAAPVSNCFCLGMSADARYVGFSAAGTEMGLCGPSPMLSLNFARDRHCQGTSTCFGASCAGTGGKTPTLAFVGCAQASERALFSIHTALGGSVALLLLGAANAPPGGGADCQVLLSPATPLPFLIPLQGAQQSAGAGWVTIPVLFPPVVASGSLGIQALVADPAGPAGYTSTQGIELTFP